MGNGLIRLRCLPPRGDRKNKSDNTRPKGKTPANDTGVVGNTTQKSKKSTTNSVKFSTPDTDKTSHKVKQFEFTGFKDSEGSHWDDKLLTSLLGGVPTKLEDTHAVELGNGLIERYAVVLADGSVYCGQWKDTVRHGHGKHYSMDGTLYVGSFVNDKYDGVGDIHYINGDNFKGVFRNGLRNGKGVMVYKNGDMFDGNWVDGLREGFGVERFADGSVYMGNFKNDKREGRGELRFGNGAIYEGTFDNEITGVGKMSWPNGESYEGEFKNGYKHRYGVTRYKCGPIQSEKGMYDMGRMNGVFECVMGNGYVMRCVYKDGEFVQDVTNRKDIEKYPSYALPESLGNEMCIIEEAPQHKGTQPEGR